jgi:subtilase family serine protease
LRAVCPPQAPGRFRCFAVLRTGVHGGFGVRGPAAAGHPGAAALPPGYGPAQLRSAYHLPATGGKGQTVAVIDAGGDPQAAADLAVYRATYHLPPCTTATGCFRQVNQHGKPNPLPHDRRWGPEISLDLDMVSAACPSCHILLTDASNATFADLAAAVDTAARLGATEISNSYGADEQDGMRRFEAAYRHPRVAVVAASGDAGYGVPSFPAVLTTVIAAAGTTLTRAHTPRGWAEQAWHSDGGATGSGCSAWISKPPWQHDPHCPGRMTADIAADADPNTGPAIYDTHDHLGWTIAGGTSAAAPFIAGVIALAGHPALFPTAAYLYTHHAALHDITTGTNALPGGSHCGGDYQCHALPGYDGPTGNGTPNGLTGF